MLRKVKNTHRDMEKMAVKLLLDNFEAKDFKVLPLKYKFYLTLSIYLIKIRQKYLRKC